MEVALRRRLEGVAGVTISQSQQTAAVTFLSGTRAFSSAAFRAAVAEAEVTVVGLEVDVCGVLDQGNALRASTDFATTLVRIRGDRVPEAGVVCVTGRLKEDTAPYELDLAVARPSS